jgi:general secretion pathway protein A
MAMLRQAAAEVMGDPGAPLKGGNHWQWVALACLVVVLSLGWWLSGRSVQQLPGPAQVAQPGPAAALPLSLPSAGEEAATAEIPSLGNGSTADAVSSLQAQEADPWYSVRGEGLSALAGYLGVADVAGEMSCSRFEELGWRCERQQAQTWDEVLNFDRPALLTLVTEDRFAAYAALVGVRGDRGLLRFRGVEVERPLAGLGRFWQGEFVFLWQPPPEYNGPVSLGDEGPMVAWLAMEFARIDGQPRPLTDDAFNADLDARVRLFQRQFQLRDDGVVGMKTLLKLSEVRGTARPLARDASRLANMSLN